MVGPAERLSSVQEYYFSRKLAEIRQRMAEGKPIINLGVGNPDLPPPPAVVDGLRTSVLEDGAHGYQPYQGLPQLREAIAQWSEEFYQVTLDPQREILPLIGSKEGIFHVSMAFVNPGDVVLVPDPGYPTYTAVSNLVGAEVMSYPLREENDWQPELEMLVKLPLERVKLLWLNTPHMPTGQVMNPESLHRLIDLAKRYNFLIVNDNPYSLILSDRPRSIFQLPDTKEVCLELNSLSKSHHMPGWRMGWVSGAAEHVQQVLRVKSNQDSGMFRPIQEAAIKALQTPPNWHERQNEIYADRQAQAQALLRQLGCTPLANQQGLFVWAKLPDEIANAEVFSDRLLYDYDIFIPPGTIFGAYGAGYVRVSLCVPEEVFIEARNRIPNSTP